MVDDSLEDTDAATDSTKPRRTPPTIDLKATEVSGETRAAPAAEAKAESEAGMARPEAAAASAGAPSGSPAASPAISPWVIAPFSGAVAAALVILVGWMLGWPQVAPPSAAPQVNAAALDDLASRVAGLETRTSTPDSTVVARLDALEKGSTALRGDIANARAQADKLVSALNDMKSAPRDGAAASVDLSDVNERVTQLERAVRAASTQAGEKAAEAKPADDMPLRRVVAAALLDVAVRHGDPYAAALNTAKALAPDPDALKPLDQFAEGGVPAPPALTRELLTLVPKLSPAAQDGATTGTGLVDRLQAGAAKLVRIERTDSTGTDRSAVVARVTAAALRKDFNEARRELSSLSPADRAPAQAWLDKAAARDAALAASRQFSEQSMAALARAAQ